MYIPKPFAEDDRETLLGVIRDNPFGLLTGRIGGAPFATHLPFLVDGDRLLSHMARGNPHWKVIDGATEMLAVFSGPHAYVSPRWYGPGDAVPTWNYVAVHVYGAPRLIEDAAETRDLLDRLVAEYEDGAWSLAGQDEEYLARMTRGIAAFEMPMTRTEGKFKLSQNRGEADRRSVAEQLAKSPDSAAAGVARLMREREDRD
jgi:transcriptional regulator